MSSDTINQILLHEQMHILRVNKSFFAALIYIFLTH